MTVPATNRYDIHYQIIDPTQQRTYGNFTFELNNSIRVKGKYKPVNRWLKIFLTPKNSHPIRRTEGTDFYAILGTNFTNLNDLQMQIMEYMEDASNQLRIIEGRIFNLPTEETFDRVELLQFNEISNGSFEIHIRIYNKSGTSVGVLIPYAMVNG